MTTATPLVHVRTPTYRRPELLRRCLESLRAQTWTNWVCDVFDDDRDGSGRAVCEELADGRIRYQRNASQNYASKNIDQCFTRSNPHGADYFCVVEDDNYILPTFMQENIELSRKFGVAIVFRNQLMEMDSGTPQARLTSNGILDRMFKEGVYSPDEFRLSLLPGIGISNGGVFWSAAVRSELEIGFPCTATLQEYMRTFSIAEEIYVAMEPLAVWAVNGEQTTRDLGSKAGYLKRELDLKRAIQVLQRQAWRLANPAHKHDFLKSERFAYSPRLRAKGLVKGLIALRVGTELTWRENIELVARGMLIYCGGQLTDDFRKFLAHRIRALQAPGLSARSGTP